MPGRVVILLTFTTLLTSTLASAQAPPPISYAMWQQLRNNPQALQQLQSPSPRASVTAAPAPLTASPWQLLQNYPSRTGGFGFSNRLLMTDGSVIVHNGGAPDWWKLTPDINGSYINGTWSQLASLPAGYDPLYFGSAVLPDGRIIINGGEYNNGTTPVWTNRGAIYSPSLSIWRPIPPPAGWANIGDASTVVLSDGTYMLANGLTSQQAVFKTNESGGISTLIWVITGNGKADINAEEGWTLLPSGNVLTVDTYLGQACGSGSEIYEVGAGIWASGGNTPSQLYDCGSHEMGPQVLRPDGTVVAFGAVTSGVSPTAIFDSTTSAWNAGPDLPTISGQNYTLADAPAALLPSGNILFAASPGLFAPPVHFFEFDGTSFIQQPDTTDAPATTSYFWNFLVLPTGQILATDFFTIWIYTPSGAPNPSWAPMIDTYPANVVRGTTYQLTGQQFNGLSQGAFYGDDAQGATNFPIVRLINSATGDVFYARTWNFNTMSVAPNTISSTNFVAPSNAETGWTYLSVIANGIASDPVAVVVQ